VAIAYASEYFVDLRQMKQRVVHFLQSFAQAIIFSTIVDFPMRICFRRGVFFETVQPLFQVLLVFV
jgi:hypothetical protein